MKDRYPMEKRKENKPTLCLGAYFIITQTPIGRKNKWIILAAPYTKRISRRPKIMANA